MEVRSRPSENYFCSRCFATTVSMIFAGLLFAFLFASRCSAIETTTAAADQEIPFVIAAQGGSDDGKASNLLPDFPEEPPLTDLQAPGGSGRSDVEIERNGQFGGYFYPKPSKPFHLPQFKALDASAAFGEDVEGVDRLPRSPQYRRPQFQPPPPFVPGFIPPPQIRPLPALYARPALY